MRTILLPKVISCVLAGCLLLNVTGCETARDCSLTHKLWTSGDMRDFYEPAPNPRLQLFHDRDAGDVLAAYDEVHETRSAIRRRAYFVNRNRLRIEAGRKPRFVNPERASGLTAISLAGLAPDSAPDTAAIHAVVSKNGQEFTLSGDFGGHNYQLPVYPDRSGLAAQVLLSPFAVTGDVVMVGIVTGVVAAYLYASRGR